MHVLIDAHAHLHDIDPVAPVIENARQAGIVGIVAVGMDLASNQRTLALARQYPGIVLPAVGYHPWSILPGDVDTNLSFLQAQLKNGIALGEVGLDYKVKVKKTRQIEVLSEVLKLAVSEEKPVILHARFSHRRSHAMVAAAGIQKAVFHWYSGPIDILDRIIADGYYVSATPALAYSPPHRAAIAHTPLEKILIETDSPVAYQGKVSEPCHLLETLHHLSVLKNMPEGELAGVVTGNARTFFGL